MKKLKSQGSFDRLSAAEKEAIYQQCEHVRPEDGTPLTAADRRMHRKAGLPVDQRSKRINILIEPELLKTADKVARKKGMTRAKLIAESVRAYVSGAA